MAWIERRGRQFRIKFRHGQKNYQVALGTTDEVEAEHDLARFRENLRLLERGRLTLPAGADLGRFLLSDGRLEKMPAFVAPTTVEVLGYVRANTTSTWLYPFFVAIAHTGARRSELLRMPDLRYPKPHENGIDAVARGETSCPVSQSSIYEKWLCNPSRRSLTS